MLCHLIDHISITKWWIKMFVSLILWIFIHELLCSFCNQIYPFDYYSKKSCIESALFFQKYNEGNGLKYLIRVIIKSNCQDQTYYPYGKTFHFGTMCIASLCCHTAEFDMLFYDMKDFGQASLQLFLFFSTEID